jgi:lysophospholipase L1-like esterase
MVTKFRLLILVLLKKLLLCDSLGKHLGELPGVERLVRRGATIETFINALSEGEISLTGKDAVLVMVGTNDMANSFNPQAVLSLMGSLIRRIHQVNSSIHVVVSGILPRLCDLDRSEQPVKDYNKMLGRVCRDSQIMMIRAYNGFTSGKEPRGVREWLYAKDGLHLSDRGSCVLTQMLRVQFSDRNILKRMEVITAEAEHKEDRNETFGLNYGH